jgi:hypothetical protein
VRYVFRNTPSNLTSLANQPLLNGHYTRLIIYNIFGINTREIVERLVV